MAAVSTVLLISPILSPQYLVWLLPWAALAAPQHRWLALLTFATVLVTGFMWFDPDRSIVVFKSLLMTRNALLLGVLASSLTILTIGHSIRQKVPIAQPPTLRGA